MTNPKHLAKLEEGVVAWNAWREEDPSIRPDLLRAILYQADLSGAYLIGADLSGANLTAAKLSGADLFEANLLKADLSVADLSGAILYGAKLSGADLRRSNLTDANVTDVRYLDFGIQGAFSLWPRLRTNPIPYRRGVMRERYQGIRGLSSSYGNRLFVRDAADQDYLDTIERQWRSRWGRFLFWCWGLIDYGRSLSSVIVFASILIFGFGWVYSCRPGILSYGGRTATPFTPYYFSIVTYTTLGFGDVKPANLLGEILVSIEVILGYVTLGLLLAVLAEKIARRS